jgi:hypothetical protein
MARRSAGRFSVPFVILVHHVSLSTLCCVDVTRRTETGVPAQILRRFGAGSVGVTSVVVES